LQVITCKRRTKKGGISAAPVSYYLLKVLRPMLPLSQARLR